MSCHAVLQCQELQLQRSSGAGCEACQLGVYIKWPVCLVRRDDLLKQVQQIVANNPKTMTVRPARLHSGTPCLLVHLPHVCALVCLYLVAPYPLPPKKTKQQQR